MHTHVVRYAFPWDTGKLGSYFGRVAHFDEPIDWQSVQNPSFCYYQRWPGLPHMHKNPSFIRIKLRTFSMSSNRMKRQLYPKNYQTRSLIVWYCCLKSFVSLLKSTIGLSFINVVKRLFSLFLPKYHLNG